MKKLKAIALVIVSCLVLTGCGCQKDAEQYTVTFDSNGGSAVVNQVVEDGKTVSKPAEPTREGYTFAGWYVGDDEYDFSKGVTGNVTITAKWVKAEPASGEKACTKTCGTGYTLQNPDSKDCKCVKDSSSSNNTTKPSTGNNTGSNTGSNTGTNTKPNTGSNSGTTTKPSTPSTPSTVAVTGVSLNKSALELAVGASETLTATVTPSNATNKTTGWSSDNTSVATVDANGKVTAVGAGTATIYVGAGEGSDYKTAYCIVTVKANTYVYVNMGKPSGYADGQVGYQILDAAGKDVTGANVKLVDADGYSVATYDSAVNLLVGNESNIAKYPISKVVISGTSYDVNPR